VTLSRVVPIATTSSAVPTTSSLESNCFGWVVLLAEDLAEQCTSDVFSVCNWFKVTHSDTPTDLAEVIKFHLWRDFSVYQNVGQVLNSDDLPVSIGDTSVTLTSLGASENVTRAKIWTGFWNIAYYGQGSESFFGGPVFVTYFEIQKKVTPVPACSVIVSRAKSFVSRYSTASLYRTGLSFVGLELFCPFLRVAVSLPPSVVRVTPPSGDDVVPGAPSYRASSHVVQGTARPSSLRNDQ